MAVAYDTSSESHTGTTGSTSEASFSWTHTPVGQPKGVLVYTFVNANADNATAVTYGGVSLDAVTGGRAVDTLGEAGDCKAWFLGRNVPPSVQAGFSTSIAISVAAYNGQWVATGASGKIRATLNPKGNWASASSGFGTDSIDGIATDGTTWVAGGGTTTAFITCTTNPAGTWTAASSPGFTTYINDVSYGNGYWIAVAGSGEIRYATTPTGTWTTPSSPGTGSLSHFCANYGNGYWCIGGQSSSVRYATDPTGTWSAASSPGFSNDVLGVAYGNGYWVGVGDNGDVRYTATNPTGTWSAASSPGFGTNQVRCVAYGGGYWVAGGASGSLRYTTNPTGTWSAASSPGFGTNKVFSVAYDGGMWVAVGENGQVRWTTDPTGTWYGTEKTVTVTRTNNSNVMYGVCATVTANGSTSVHEAGIVTQSTDGTLAEQSVTDGSPGTNSLRFGGINSGLGSIGTTDTAATCSNGANSTRMQSIDYGNRVTDTVVETTAGQGSRSVGFVCSATSDDRAAVYLAVRERFAPPPPPQSYSTPKQTLVRM